MFTPLRPTPRQRAGTALGLFAFFIVSLIIGFASNGVADNFDVSFETAFCIAIAALFAVGVLVFVAVKWDAS